jgi:hypothetical protein
MLLRTGDRCHLTRAIEIRNNAIMRAKSFLLAFSLCAATAWAQEPQAYLSGKLLQMESVQCEAFGSAKGSGSQASASKTGKDKAQAIVCPEYILQGDEVMYRIRPINAKHADLLPVGEWAQFRFQEDKLFVRVQALDDKEREYFVVSMTPRGDNSADSIRIHLNHLQ